jgi:hypothetical protein
VEADGKPDGKIPLEKFAEILDCDPVWKVSSLNGLIENTVLVLIDCFAFWLVDYSTAKLKLLFDCLVYFCLTN